MEKIYLGKISNNFNDATLAGEEIFLSKHSWDCGWYWGFGWLGNRNLHTHFNGSLLGAETNVDNIFEETNMNQNEWWVIRDLMIQAYALKNTAEVYRHGGYQSNRKGITDIIQNKEMENIINSDLKKILDITWDFINKSIQKTYITKTEAKKRFKINVLNKIKEEKNTIDYIKKVTFEWNYFLKKLLEVKEIKKENLSWEFLTIKTEVTED